jgi:hypothetical protein
MKNFHEKINNGLTRSEGHENKDIVHKYFKAYSCTSHRVFIKRNTDWCMVMPLNEFKAAQIFPSLYLDFQPVLSVL